MSSSRRRALASRAIARAPWCGPVVVRTLRAAWCCSPLVSRCDRARCLAAGPPGSRRRATARGGSPPRCVAWHPAIFARALRMTTGHAHYPGGAIGTSRPTAITLAQSPWPRPRRAHRCAAWHPAFFARALPDAHCLWRLATPHPGSRRRATAPGGSPPRCAALHPAPSPCAPPVPYHLAGFGVQSRSMSAARLHRPLRAPSPLRPPRSLATPTAALPRHPSRLAHYARPLPPARRIE